MKTLYDVQQLLKKFNIYVYVGKRLWDIEVIALELDKLHQARLITQREFIQAKLILTQQHRIEEQKSNGSDS